MSVPPQRPRPKWARCQSSSCNLRPRARDFSYFEAIEEEDSAEESRSEDEAGNQDEDDIERFIDNDDDEDVDTDYLDSTEDDAEHGSEDGDDLEDELQDKSDSEEGSDEDSLLGSEEFDSDGDGLSIFSKYWDRQHDQYCESQSDEEDV